MCEIAGKFEESGEGRPGLSVLSQGIRRSAHRRHSVLNIIQQPLIRVQAEPLDPSQARSCRDAAFEHEAEASPEAAESK